MGGLMKGHGGGYGNGSRGRPFAMMLLLAFGAAIIGVMVLHRFRERRIFNLLIKEKDTDLISLQLLLQKEKDHVKEAKWKLEDMRSKIHSLRTQKRELDNRIMEMHSTVSSLREEQKTIESALEEKQKEIKMLRDKNTYIENENPQVKALSETLRQKESEIEDLKQHLESPSKIWSVSTDDPSNASIDSQMKTRATGRDKISVNQVKEYSAELDLSTNQEAGENSTEHVDSNRGRSGNNRNEEVAKQGEVRRENGGETAESREVTEEQSQKQDNSKESNTEKRNVEEEGKNSDISKNGGEEKETSNTEAVGNHSSDVQRPREETNKEHASDDKVTETTSDGVLGSNAQGAENQEQGMNLKGGMKLEMPENSQIGRHRRKGKSSNLKRTKGKRWTTMIRSKAGNSENKETAVRSEKRSGKTTLAEMMNNNEPQNKGSRVRDETGAQDPGLEIFDNLQNGKASEHEDSKDVWQPARNTASYIQMEETDRTNGTSVKTEMAHISLKDALTNMTLHIDGSKASLEGDQNTHEFGQSEKQANGIQQLEEEIARQEEDVASEQTKTSDFDEPNNPEIEDLQEQESETETSRESTSKFEADGEQRKGKNDEPEF